MDTTTQEIFEILDKLLEGLGLQLEEYDFVFLTQAELYVEMFKLMFPTLGPMLEIDFAAEDINDEELIQSLLDFLSQYVIKVELDHISSELITKGDPKHILNFLNLLYEISKMMTAKEGESEEVEEGEEGEEGEEAHSEQLAQVPRGDKQIKSSPNSFKQLSEYSQRSSDPELQGVKYHTAQGIPEEFEDQMVEVQSGEGDGEEQLHGEEEPSEEEIAQMLRQQANKSMKKQAMENAYDYNPPQKSQDSYSGSRISEVSKSKEFSDYEMNTKKKSQGGRRTADLPSEENFERQRNLEALKWNRREQQQQHQHQHQHQHQEEEAHRGQVDEEQDDDGEYYEGSHSEQYISIRDGSSRKQKLTSHLEGDDEDEHDDDDQEVEYVDDYEGEEGEEGDEDIHHPTGAESRKGEHSEDIQYYASDPIDYQFVHGKKLEEQARAKARAQEQEEEEEESKQPESEVIEEEQEGEYDYQDQASGRESHAEESEPQQGDSQYDTEQERQQMEYYQAVAEAHALEQQRESLKKARPQTAKPHKAGDVQFRPLRPVTGNVVRPSTGTGKRPSQKTGQAQKKGKKVPSNVERREYDENQVSRSHQEQESSRQSQRESNSQASRRSQNAYQQGFNDFAREQAMRQRKLAQERQSAQKRVSTKKFKTVTIKPESLKTLYEIQQGHLYDRMRDEKLDYLKKIHKIIYQLDKKKIMEEKKAYQDHRRGIDEETINMMITIKTNYKEKIDMLKRGHLSDKNERKLTDYTQKLFLKTLKQELNFDQMKEIERLRNRWANEKARFEMMTMDENFLEKRLVDLYKK